jgi:hypothetical protein
MTTSGQKQRDRFQPWVEKSLRPRFPELEAPLMAAVDAFDLVQRTDELLPQRLRPILDAVSSSRRGLYENTCEFMQILSAKWPEANEAIVAMSQSTKAHVRFNAILCLGDSTPGTTVERILKSGLLDKSSRVRRKAADWICRLRKTEFVPELAIAQSSEPDAKVRSGMEFSLRLLRDGYILRPGESGFYELTVLRDDGSVIGTSVKDETLRTRGVDAIASELRRPRPYEAMPG